LGFIIKTMTSDKLGAIESTEGQDIALQVFSPAQVSSSSVSLSMTNTTVQAYANYEFLIRFPMAVGKGCQIEFLFPAEYFGFDSSFVAIYAKGAMSNENVTYMVHSGATYTTIRTTSGCSSSAAAEVAFILRFIQLKNNEYALTAPNIDVKLYDSSGSMAAAVASGLEATIDPGELVALELAANASQYVLDEANLRFFLKPVHTITANSKISIEFPTSDPTLQLPSACQILDWGLLLNPSPSCSRSGQTFTLTNVLRDPYVPGVAGPWDEELIKFSIAGFTLPRSSRPFGVLKMGIYSFVNGDYQLID